MNINQRPSGNISINLPLESSPDSVKKMGSPKPSFLTWVTGSSKKERSLSPTSITSGINSGSSSRELTPNRIQVIPRLSKQELEEAQSLFFSKEFKTMIGTSWFTQDRDTTQLLSQVDKYHEKEKEFSDEEKMIALNQLETAVQSYHAKKSANNSAPKESKAAEFLLTGIALEKQKLFCRDSHYQSSFEISHREASVSGAMNKPKIITYRQYSPRMETLEKSEDESHLGEGFDNRNLLQDKSTVTGYFKSVGSDPMKSLVASDLGISSVSTAVANLSGRAVATYRMAQLLGMSASSSQENDLVPETNFAVHDGSCGSLQLEAPGKMLMTEEVQEQNVENDEDIILDIINGDSPLTLSDLKLKDSSLSIKMDRNSGEEKIFENNQPLEEQRARDLIKENKIVRIKKIITSVTPVDFKNPDLQREISQAQLLDLLTGQIDRNAGNFIYQQEQENWHVKLIDSDLSFPPKLESVDYASVKELTKSPVVKKLPRFVDKTVAEKILMLTKQDLASALQGTGLTQQEIAATQKRLEALQMHLRSLPENQFLDTWNDQTYEKQMEVEDNYVYQNQTNQNLALNSKIAM